MKVHLLAIDPQFDFVNKSGSLSVPGAQEDMERLAAFIDRVGSKLDDIHVTLDSHHPLHIANAVFWKDSHGDHPNPFTIITAKDVADGRWMASMPGFQRWCIEYTQSLEKNGKYPLCVWPDHTLIGSNGAKVDETLFKSLLKWEQNEFAVVDYVTKGSNIRTEHYSAVKADVPDPKDPSTQINTNLISTLMEADFIVLGGEAGSHCLSSTTTDIADAFGDDKYIQKLVLLTDATSPVPGFEKNQEEFIKRMVARGMQLSTTDKFLR
jgi:nicotinamidase/pyrazinamidase